MTIPSLVLDIIVAVLLIVTIGYAMVLNRKISGLRRDKAQLEKLAATFSSATNKAGVHLADLHKTAGELDAQIKAATGLRDDLAFLVDRGGRTADKLEDAVRHSRGDSGVDLSEVAPRAAGAGQARTTTAAVHDIQAAKRRAAKPAVAPSQKARPAPTTEPPRAPSHGVSRAEPQGLEPRSEAERELLRALRAAR